MESIEAAARILWGEPTSRTNDDVRFGHSPGGNGISIKPSTGEWYDHKENQGGDLVAMVKHYCGFDNPLDATKWLLEHDIDYKAGNGADRWPEYIYVYCDENGAPLFEVVRLEPPGKEKIIFQRKPGEKKSTGIKGIRRVPYRLPELIAAIKAGETVYIPEGEKKVDRLRALGLAATCNAEGAGKWEDAYSAHMRVAHCVILPDNDQPGRDHGRAVARSLQPYAASVRVLELPGLADKGDIVNWLDAGGTVDQLKDLAAKAEPDRLELPPSWVHGERDPLTSRRWLVKGLLPEVGSGLLAGQWGTYKSFAGLDIAGAVMTGAAFMGAYRIKRQCGVMWIATESAEEVIARLEALVREKCGSRMMPFVCFEDCPPLLKAGSLELLAAMARDAEARIRKNFDLPLGLIEIDTIIGAAGYAKPGDENDPVVGAQLMKVLDNLAKQTRTFTLGLDHYGKNVETGTRGASSKEDNTPIVIAMLGKETDGQVTNPELVIRKSRFGRAGLHYAFTVRSVDLGYDEDNDPISTLVIDWASRARPSAVIRPWPKPLLLLQRILVELISAAGVEAVDLGMVRRAFYNKCVVSGDTPEKQAENRKKAFKRALDKAQQLNLVDVDIEQNKVWIAGSMRGGHFVPQGDMGGQNRDIAGGQNGDTPL
jgi:hypothetical protein